MLKKFFAWILAAALIINLPAINLNAAEDGFTDIGKHWAKDIIIKFTDQGILSGYPDGTFQPDGYLSRAEAVTLLNKFFNITQSGYPDFLDVKPEDWFYFQVGAAHERGYIQGYPDGSFKPDKDVSRMESFLMIYNLLGMPEYNNVSALNRFLDINDIPADKPLYRQIVAYMSGNGIVNAYPDGTLRVNSNLTRAEMLSLLNKVSDMIMNTNSIMPENNPTETPETTAEETPAETLTPTPEPAPEAGTSGSWVAPLRPGNNWNLSGGGLSVSALSIDPSSFMLSGSGFLRGGQPGSQGNDPGNNQEPGSGGGPTPDAAGSAGLPTAAAQPAAGAAPLAAAIPLNMFTLLNGYMDIEDNTVVITDSDSAYLNGELTLPEDVTIELHNSTLILMYDLNVTDENHLIGDRDSEIIERGGILNIGNDPAVRSRKAEITPGTYYYDAKKGRWRAMK